MKAKPLAENSPILEQAVGQKLLLTFAGKDRPSPEILDAIRQIKPAGFTLFRALNVGYPAQLRALTGALQQAAREAGMAPLLIAADQEGGQLMAIGDGTLFPGNMALGATDSPELARRTGFAIGQELAAMGVNVDYAPVCDVNANPLNPGVGTRSFGEDPVRVAHLSSAMVEGLQAAGVAATAKHFPGLGDASTDSHYGTPVLLHDRDRLNQVELPPFEAAIRSGVRMVLIGHIGLPELNKGVDIPATLSPSVIGGLLRRDLGFEGVIVTDAMDMKAIQQGPGLASDAVAAVKAGVDLLLLSGSFEEQRMVYAALLQAVRGEQLSLREIYASAARVAGLRDWLAGQSQPDLGIVNCREHRDLADEIACRAITLVRDSAKILPVHLFPQARVAAIMPRPQDLTPADTSSFVAPGLAEPLRRYHPGVDEYIIPINPDAADIAGLSDQVANYDLIVVGTIDAGRHLGQAAVVNTLLQSQAPVVVVALRLPYDLQAFPNAPTYACTYSILPPALHALAAALFGKIPFAGRLPVTIPGI